MYKFAIYTICKNELVHVDKWYNSLRLADAIYILDTGSTDGTLEKLQEIEKFDPKFHLYQKSYEHFSFGDAWNTILEKIPEDIDFVFRVDMDQWIVNKYWPFELSLTFMREKVDPKQSTAVWINMFEKNFSRVENHMCVSSRDVRWAGDIHERQYFPGVSSKNVRGLFVPILIYHNQKYPSTNGTGIPGCQKRFDFYADIANNQYFENNTVFNFLHYVMAHGNTNDVIKDFFLYITHHKEFKECDRLTTYDMDYKPQIFDIISTFMGLLVAIKSIDNFKYHQEKCGKLDMSVEYPYVVKLLDQLQIFFFGLQVARDNGLPLRTVYGDIEEMAQELESCIKDFKKYFK